MSLSYVLGNLIGRALISFLIVWVVWLCVSRFNLGAAWARSKRWYSWIVVALMTLLGLGSAVVTSGGLR